MRGYAKKETVGMIIKVVVLTIVALMLLPEATSASTQLNMDIGQTMKLFDANGLYKFSSGNQAVATVTTSGTVSAKKAGKCTISMKQNGKVVGTVIVTVSTDPTTVSLNKGNMALKKGKTETLKSVIPAGSRTTFTWLSSNAKIAKVDGNGKVTALKAGSCTISVRTANGKTASCTVKVS